MKELSLAYHKKRFPNVPEHCLPAPKYSDRTANGLTRMIIDYIKFKGNFAERVNSVGIYDRKLGKYRPSGSRKGTSDISAIVNGRSVRIEVKIGTDRLSIHQRKYAEEVTNAGALFFVAANFKDFKNWYNQNFQL